MEGLEDLPDAAGLADTGFADDSAHLTAALPCLSQCLRQERHLSLAAHHGAEAPHRSRLQPCLHWPCAQHLKDLQWITEALDRHVAKCLHLHIALYEPLHRRSDLD